MPKHEHDQDEVDRRLAATETDARGYPYLVEDIQGTSFPYYVTDCCAAPVSIFTDDGSTYCKCCYEDADPILGLVPILEG